MFSRYFSLMHLLRCSEFASDRCRSARTHRHPSTAIPNTTARHLPGRSYTCARRPVVLLLLFARAHYACQPHLVLVNLFLTVALVYRTSRRPVKPGLTLETRGLEPLTYALQRHRSPS
jgi:hypothetical protein